MYTTTTRPAGTWALTADGTTVLLRPPGPEDTEPVMAMLRDLSPQSLRHRYLGRSDSAVVDTAVRVCRPPRPGDGALLAEHEGRVVALAEFLSGDTPGEAELALAVADGWQHRGLGTLLVEHLAPLARQTGVGEFVADAWIDNEAVRKLFADLGLPARSTVAQGLARYRVDLAPDPAERAYERYLTALADREEHADVASLAPLLSPRRIAVAGAGRSPDSVGRAVLRALRDGGFTGEITVVHPTERDIAGVPAYPDPADIPSTPDLVVAAVPAGAVPALAERCGRGGVRAMVVLAAGLDREARRDLHDICRRHGMRLVGPNCLGVANTDAAVRLDATFAGVRPLPGTVGVAVQSGGIGIALARHLNRLGIGVSTFASLGDKADVSGNDMLRWWDSDGRTTMAVLHLESFGNPRKFSRLARRLGRRMPVLTVDAGRSEAGRRGQAAHTGAAAAPEFARAALFEQAGVISTRSLGDLVATAALLGTQALPRGPAVAVVGNTAGACVLAADALTDAGLTVPAFDLALRERLAEILPPGSACHNPVDTGPAVTAGQLAVAADAAVASGQADAVLLAVTPTAMGDPLNRLPRYPGAAGYPMLVVAAGQPEAVTLIPTADTGVPAYADADAAAQALAHAVARSRHLSRPVGAVPSLDRLDAARAIAVIDHALEKHPLGGRMPPTDCAALLDAYAIAHTGHHDLAGRATAADAAATTAGPGEARLRARITQDAAFGPLLTLAPPGAGAREYAVRLTPLTDVDLRDMIAALRETAPELRELVVGKADTGALADLLHRLCRLADDHPPVISADLDPVVVRPGGAYVAGAEIGLAPHRADGTAYLPKLA